MYVPVPAPGGAPNGGAGGTRDFEAQDADAAASVRKTVDSLMALPAAADAYLQLLKPQQGGQGAVDSSGDMLVKLKILKRSAGEVGTTLTLFHGSPYSNVDVSEAPLLYYTANIDIARD